MDDPARRPWYYGRISRVEAEKYLHRTGMVNGSFLLRKRPTEPKSYALSVCYDNSVIHYHIKQHPDGKYGIEDGPRFINPVELIEYHRSNQGGLLTTLSSPCNRPPGVEPKVYTNVDQSEVTKAMSQLGIASGGKNAPFEEMFGKFLHTKQDWFHGSVSRVEAESRLRKCGTTSGLFLVREREKEGTFAIGLCNDGCVYHYLLDTDAAGELSIRNGPKFSNLMECVEYYRNRSDGLVCKLTIPCPISNFEGKQKPSKRPPAPVPPVSPVSPTRGQRENPPPLPETPTPRTPIGAEGGRAFPRTDAIYDTVAMKKSAVYHNAFKGIKALDVSRLTLENKLGQGNFGSVLKGVYTVSNGNKIEVAVKQLKTEGATQKSEIEHEARIMMKLDHPNIVRMIGMCHQATMMLVMELAADGPLHKYLRKHKGLSPRQILIMMLQVSEGMAYLDSMHFVHRDLAARNVLVVNDNFVKISDFGMSRAMGVGNDYYKAERAGKWPLKWYAPECIYYFKFTTKSDVWSFGITMWESLTYGGKPYEGLQGQQVIQFLEDKQRLTRPLHCPENVYAVMCSCWEFEPGERPAFSEITRNLSIMLHQMSK